jgi:exonuclease, DNA polymerase III, epsilon subunit family
VPHFAVIDVETTGLSPAHQHRIVEVAVVLVDEDGLIEEAWDTLINPQRDVGAYDVHGIRAADLYDAPRFEDIAGELASLLAGRVPVAHNWPFEASFLTAEYERLGIKIPLDHQSGLCTLRMALHYLPVSSRSLEACCECIRYPLKYAHEALEDAKAAAALLAHYLGQDGPAFTRRWRPVIERALERRWPEIPVGAARRLSRAHHRSEAPTHFLARLSTRASKPVVADEVAQYVDALDRALLNRDISRYEADELVSIAHSLGLGRDDVLALD